MLTHHYDEEETPLPSQRSQIPPGQDLHLLNVTFGHGTVSLDSVTRGEEPLATELEVAKCRQFGINSGLPISCVFAAQPNPRYPTASTSKIQKRDIEIQRYRDVYNLFFKLSGSLVQFKLCCSTRKALMMPVLFPTGTTVFPLTFASSSFQRDLLKSPFLQIHIN